MSALCPVCGRLDGWQGPHGGDEHEGCECAACKASCWGKGDAWCLTGARNALLAEFADLADQWGEGAPDAPQWQRDLLRLGARAKALGVGR